MDGRDCIKVRVNSKVVNKTIYLAAGLNRDGKKEVLGMWLGLLTDLKARGVEDMLINATDNLYDFTQTIKNVFPESQTQICVVHQILILGFKGSNQKMVNANPKLGINPQSVLNYI